MAPRDTPGYRLHRPLTALRDIETDALSDADAHRVTVATLLLTEGSVLSEVGRHREADD